MSNEAKPNTKLTQLISEFEGTVRSFSPELWPEKSFNKLINHYEHQGHINSALEVVNLALSQYKTKADFHLIRARLLMRQSRLEEALDSISFAEQFAPSHDIDLIFTKVKIFCLQRKEHEALHFISGFRCGYHKTDLQEIILAEAFIYESMKDFEKMFYSLKEALTLNPNNSKALQQIWVSVEFSKKYEESISLHQHIIDQNPYSHLAWYNLGHAWSCIGEYEKALEALEYSYLINPQFEQAYLDCAELSLQLGQYEKAYRCYHEANDIFGPDTEMIVYMAECLTKLNRHSEAKELLKQSIAQDPYNDEVFFYLGECYTHESNWTKALDCYQEALELDEYREEFHLGAAVANENMGLLKKAEFHYNKAANLGQEQSLYWTRFIQFLLKNKNYSKVAKILDKADKYSVGTDLSCCRVAWLFFNDSANEAYTLIEEILQDSNDGLKVLFEILPELKEDVKLKGMVRYFSYSN
ncbi:MAG: tetratricopeptide repeat protein [Saprospiraceae bacterium]|nr:tetratricopeptide repeat protein [Saprospiraceae bacterium]MBK7810909.1 tetratricopeptide repeat protein [Saprospiraceae bacterium]MBK9630512.1 tetratricopeptide repeat protein [Saprospiraceae bacterium]